jgi:hypothetical protein
LILFAPAPTLGVLGSAALADRVALVGGPRLVRWRQPYTWRSGRNLDRCLARRIVAAMLVTTGPTSGPIPRKPRRARGAGPPRHPDRRVGSRGADGFPASSVLGHEQTEVRAAVRCCPNLELLRVVVTTTHSGAAAHQRPSATGSLASTMTSNWPRSQVPGLNMAPWHGRTRPRG